MNRNELIHVVIGQYAVFFLVTIGAAFFGVKEMLSSLLGGMCVVFPNSVFALILMRSLSQKKPLNPLVMLLGEIIKLLAVCLLLITLVKLWPAVNWPAMLVAIGAAALSNLGLIFYKY